MALTTYEETRPWARAIREEVLTRRMPRWHVVRGYGDFVNDPSLSPFEVALITAWVDGGAPKSLPGIPAAQPKRATAAPEPVGTREVTLPCGTRTLPRGRVVGLRPMLDKGGTLRADVTAPAGAAQPLLWVKNFEPEFRETYWLRTPVEATRTTRVRLTGSAPCALTVLLESRTAR